MVVISEADHTLCDLASRLELCFASSPRNYIRKPHMLGDVTQYLQRVIIVLDEPNSELMSKHRLGGKALF